MCRRIQTVIKFEPPVHEDNNTSLNNVIIPVLPAVVSALGAVVSEGNLVEESARVLKVPIFQSHQTVSEVDLVLTEHG